MCRMRTHLTFEDVRFTYDGSGNPVDMLDSVNKLGYTYIYENGRLQSEMQTEGAKIASGTFQGFLESILSAKVKILGNAVSFISSFSSIGGIIALFFDVMDRELDGWFRVTV